MRGLHWLVYFEVRSRAHQPLTVHLVLALLDASENATGLNFSIHFELFKVLVTQEEPPQSGLTKLKHSGR